MATLEILSQQPHQQSCETVQVITHKKIQMMDNANPF